MTIITNKRTYQFDIVAKELEDENDKIWYMLLDSSTQKTR